MLFEDLGMFLLSEQVVVDSPFAFLLLLLVDVPARWF